MRFSRFVGLVLVVVALFGGALGIAACTGPSCTRNTDCPTPLVCNDVGLCDEKPVVVDKGDGGDADGGTGDGGASSSSSSASSMPDAGAPDGLAP